MEARCMVCGNPLGDLIVVACNGIEVCSDKCADIYYNNIDDIENKGEIK